MTDLVLIARRRTQVDSRTHYPGCEREHVECLVQMMATEIEHLRNNSDNLRIVIQDSEREIERLRDELASYRYALIELRLRLHAQGRRPEECYEMRLIDAAMEERK